MAALLDSGVNPNADSSGDKGTSAVSAAASGGRLAVVQLLLDRGADVNADDAQGGNALTAATVAGNVDIVKLLVTKGCDPNAEDGWVTAFGFASHELVDHEASAPLASYRKIVEILAADGARDTFVGWVNWQLSDCGPS